MLIIKAGMTYLPLGFKGLEERLSMKRSKLNVVHVDHVHGV
jgi:hypothetical protein